MNKRIYRVVVGDQKAGEFFVRAMNRAQAKSVIAARVVKADQASEDDLIRIGRDRVSVLDVNDHAPGSEDSVQTGE